MLPYFSWREGINQACDHLALEVSKIEKAKKKNLTLRLSMTVLKLCQSWNAGSPSLHFHCKKEKNFSRKNSVNSNACVHLYRFRKIKLNFTVKILILRQSNNSSAHFTIRQRMAYKLIVLIVLSKWTVCNGLVTVLKNYFDTLFTR